MTTQAAAAFGRLKLLFYAYRIISRFYLYLPIVVIYLLHYDYSYLTIGFILASYGFAVMASKPIAGWFGRRFSRKASLVAGEWLKCLGILGLGLCHDSLTMLIISQAAIGFGFSFTQGPDSILLGQWTEKYNEQANYRKIEAVSQSYIFLAVLVAGIVGSLFAEIDLSLPILLTVPFNFAASLFVMGMQENKSTTNGGGKATAATTASGSIWRFFPVISFYAINRAVIMTFFVLVFPLLLFVNAHISVGLFGIILSLFSITAFLCGKTMGALAKKLGDGLLWAIVPIALLAASLLLTQTWSWVYYAVPILLGVASGIVRPLCFGYFNKNTGALNAKVISVSEFVFALLNASFLVLVASLFEWDINLALYAIGGFLAAVSVYQLLHGAIISQRSGSKASKAASHG
ncbi:MFS transporter [Paenibacillus sp. MMS18-CY102]|uniref:MFS transporter n=1 Tax=Paenibacillus sp. MMS18-CY102 TaxID=2682849 RepID=UPI0013654630|nr:MFS transporter [Paenibacillus sp. MMS18-CY102]MWC26881.1 MFS transporter [Paenibacillus sp. MMS18-CY102]